MKDTWRKVPGYDYEISIDTKEGRCRSLKTGIILSNKPDKRGYIQWNILDGSVRHHQQAARWIAITYPELVENEYFEGACIDHKDTDRLNNHPSNLHWVTQRQNMNNPITRKNISKALTGKHLSDETRQKLRDTHKGPRPWSINKVGKRRCVNQYEKDGTFVSSYPTTKEAERQTGVTHANITAACRGHRPSAGGYLWEYV